MEEKYVFLVSPVFSWVLMFWVLIPFLIRPFIRSKPLFRNSTNPSEMNSTFALWNAYVITCWLLLPLLLLAIKPQIQLSVQLLVFLTVSWWLRSIVEYLKRENKFPQWKYLALAHHGLNLVVLVIGISFVQSQLNSFVPINSTLEVVGSTERPVAEAADWLTYCFLVCATLISSLQFYIEFIRINPTASHNYERKSHLVQKLDLASLGVGFSHLCFQTSLLLFLNLQLLF